MITQRNQEIYDYRRRNPCLTLEQTGSHFGVSRERIRQVLVKCGVTDTWYRHPQAPCLNCGQPRGQNWKYCSLKCQFDYTHIWVVCDYCGSQFRRSQSQVIATATDPRYATGHIYCSYKCNGAAKRGKPRNNRNQAGLSPVIHP